MYSLLLAALLVLAPPTSAAGAKDPCKGKPACSVAGDIGRVLAESTLGDQDTGRVVPGPALQEPNWHMQGPWDIHTPVHEALTVATLKRALERVPVRRRGSFLDKAALAVYPTWDSTTAHAPDAKALSPHIQDVVRGAMWNDDPRNLFFDDQKGTSNYSSGALWLEEFDEGEKDRPGSLTARSHYGDLLFLHGMASQGTKPEETRARVLAWSRFCVDVATGRLHRDTLLSQVPGLADLFRKGQRQWTVADLFAGSKGGSRNLSDEALRQRAAGSLLHLIQDSWCAAHTERDEQGRVTRFNSYQGQDHARHSAGDVLATGSTLADHLDRTPGTRQAVEQGAKALERIDQGESTSRILEWLSDEVFAVSPDAQVAGPGAAWSK